MQRLQPEPQYGAIDRFEGPAFGIGPIQQDESRLDTPAVQGTDEGQDLRLGPAPSKAVDQETNADGAATNLSPLPALRERGGG